MNVVADPNSPGSFSGSPGVDAVVIAIITVVVDATLCNCIMALSSVVAAELMERECRSLSRSSPVKDSSDEPRLFCPDPNICKSRWIIDPF